MKREATELPATEVVEHAINRVLAAERDARQAVDQCRQKAREIMEAARARSRQILERSDRLISRARALSDATVEQRLAELQAESARFSDTPLMAEDRLERVRQLVPVLARELVSGGE